MKKQLVFNTQEKPFLNANKALLQSMNKVVYDMKDVSQFYTGLVF